LGPYPNSSLGFASTFLSKTDFSQEPRSEFMNCDKELDVRGLNCPLPILRTKKSLVDMATGQVLKIIATDPGSVIDFQVFADQTGNELLSLSETAGEFLFYMKKR
jgi:tRNA 2-thiouridine synthesizing protein A